MFGRSSFSQPDDIDEDGGRSERRGQEEDTDVAATQINPVDTSELTVPQMASVDDTEQAGRPKVVPVPSEHGLNEGLPERGRLSIEQNKSRSLSAAETFVSAHESVASALAADRELQPGSADGNSDEGTQQSGNSFNQRASTSIAAISTRELSPANGHAAAASSTASLISHKDKDARPTISKHSQQSLRQHEPSPLPEGSVKTVARERTGTGVRFAENIAERGDRVKGKISRAQQRASSVQLRRNTLTEGSAIKMEKMLVRIDTTLQDVSQEFDENDCQKIETQVVEKWREYMVVVRQNHRDDSDYRLQFYKSRVIPVVDNGTVRRKCQHEVYLSPKSTKVNLFSSLDKTVVLWHPYRKGARFIIMRPRATAHSVEWYTFLRDVLGWSRPSVLVVNVPDLNVSLRLVNPFRELEATRDAVAEENDQENVWKKTMTEEQAVAGRIIRRCIEMLETDPEWSDVLENWSKAEKMGLAWKRYDRLEWIHGANEQKMYGSMAMQKTHDLELRPKLHYPTTAIGKKGKVHVEPTPIEGFLVRLTSQKGVHQRLGKMFFKRLYFTTQNQFLVFCRPSRTSPPHPPRLATTDRSDVPSASEIVENSPLMYDIEPYALEDGEVNWLKSGNKTYVARHDQKAYEEQQRNIDNLSRCDGYINLCRIKKIRNVKWGATPVDEDLDEGSDVDFHQEVSDTQRDDGTTSQIDDDRIFEIVLDNGLVIRLQAYNEVTKMEWMKRLRQLVNYWKRRTTADMDLFKAVRQANLERLKIDEEMEAYVGQFARKWEVSKSEGSPLLYHIGLVTEEDLLYQNQTFDSNRPGVHALPRVYLDDGWTSRDEDTMTCFVIWHGLKKSLFRTGEDTEGGGKRQRLRQVSRLGVTGRSMVFKCRSRAERDHWVMNIGMDIDRLQQGEDVRLQGKP
ncbi:putative ph domain protein [Phaeomoniella chlamydospora]|uniref:Putative ph domain protein n=1 Tax=Phaeomoniella chlamydospora TaxID=158046 RepID=A0A0G2EI99_PHACM|nr:putative ph domain protein [Phaeomoniella chlamydospora]